jgi:hypothetical protein
MHAHQHCISHHPCDAACLSIIQSLDDAGLVAALDDFDGRQTGYPVRIPLPCGVPQGIPIIDGRNRFL